MPIGGAASALRAGQNGMETLWILGANKTRKRSRSQWVMNLDNIVGFHEDVIKSQIIKSLKNNKQDEVLVNELVKNNLLFSFMAYPNRSQGLWEGKNTKLHVYNTMTNYFLRNLEPGGK